ncbi:hypothetical protein ABKZ05_003388 [Vibrio navarrensis]|uniref:hypothetical protein n=1 Tax=Vibrio navarrensis TaxID=29495 RepID=UPI0018DDC029|nr:hypothetical protein [Vibrio navarrensis]MBH9738547.1 hypothetical protein [Vibrio navarrensis]
MAVSKLVTFRRWLIGWIKNPWVDMVIGIFVLITAILEFAVEETHQLSGAKGLFLLGSWVVLKATLRLLESVDLLVDSAQHFYKKEKPRFLLRFNFIALIHIMIAILLVVIGVSEAIQEFDSEVALSQVWHWNLVLVGAMIMVKTTGELMDAIYFASKAARKTMARTAQQAIRWLRFPRMELAMAFMVLFISAWEQLLRPGFLNLAPHHGLAFYALVHITRFFASMAETTDLIYLSESESHYHHED